MEFQLSERTWTCRSLIASGSYGPVWEVFDENGNVAAAKLVELEPGADREAVIGEYHKVTDVAHVVPIIDTGEHNYNGIPAWVMVMPKAEKTLRQHLEEHEGRLSTEEALKILRDLATALVAIKPKVVHRDLKPENILFYDGKWCVADFGIARLADVATSTATRKHQFTKQYAAPEQWRHEHATSATDVYAFGIIAYELLAGKRPFDGTPETLRELHLGQLPPQLDAGTPRIQRLIEECLQKRPEARPTAEQVLSRLQKAGESATLPAARRLGAVSQGVARRRAGWQAEEAAERAEADRRAELFNSAMNLFPSIVNPLIEEIEDEAPAAGIRKNVEGEGVGYTVHLDSAQLDISVPKKVGRWEGPFTVIAAASIQIEAGIRPVNSNWRGRSHSLWYCDAQEENRFAWYETAFMDSPLLGRPIGLHDPYMLFPDRATPALLGGLNTIQLAWPFEEIDRDDPSEFFAKWLDWLADATEGNLTRPNSMPERPTAGTWRR